MVGLTPKGARPSQAWVATGAAIGGVLLGGAAVLIGLRQPAIDAIGAQARAVAPLVPGGAKSDEPAADPADPDRVTGRGNDLVDAVARTRDAVVNLRAGANGGAGVIVAESGVVVTNFHVIATVLGSRGSETLEQARARAPQIVARFADGRELPAVVLIADREEDIAVLRLQSEDGEKFVAARRGRSAQLQVGQEVFAVGNPFGYEHSVSRGIVSALDRTNVLPTLPQLPMLQLDASINMGNSGGPLFNLQGELVGIVTAIRAKSQGIAFALPFDHVGAFLRAMEGGDATRSGTIGVTVNQRADVDEVVSALGYATGIVVDSVYQGHPAHKAGLKSGDTIVELRGRRFDGTPGGAPGRARQLVETVRALVPGETLPVTVVRDGTTHELDVEVAAASASRQAHIDAEELLGVRLSEAGQAAVVEGILPGSFLARKGWGGVLRGSRIVGVFGRKVTSTDDLGPLLAEIRAWIAAGRSAAYDVWVEFETIKGERFRTPLRVTLG